MTGCLCGGSSTQTLGIKDGRTVVQCLDCDLIRTLDPPEDYINLYISGDTYHKERLGHTPYTERFEHDRSVGKLRLAKLHETVKILDVGCANGGFLAEAKDQGYSVEGLEINNNMAEWVENQTGIKIHRSWKTVSWDYNLITYHDVIEHIIDPIEELRKASYHLAEHGLLIIDTPDADDSRFQTLGLEWHHMKPREHLWFFTEKTLLNVVRKAGLFVERIDRPIQGKIVFYCYSKYSHVYN